MLDNETKRRIDTARDILVGKVPDPKSQVEQITIALIYKFMDDMDAEAEELGGEVQFFSGEYARFGWRRMFDPSIGGFEMLTLYGEAIQRMATNPNLPQLFRDIFKNAYLPYRDPETLRAFLKTIDEFRYDHSERLGDAFEYLLSVLGSQGDAGQFRTPRHIIDFMVALLDPQKNESLLDPACGTAGFLISAYKHIIKHNSSQFDPKTDRLGFENQTEKPENGKRFSGDQLTPDDRARLVRNIRGYDISPDMVRLSLANLYLHGFTEPNIQEYDTLTSEDRWNEYADIVLANPPFMSPKGGIRPHKRFSIQSNRSEVLFVDYIAEHLAPGGRAAVIVPEGIIFQSGTAYRALRQMLIERGFLVGVISLPAGVFQPYSGVKTSILWLDRRLAARTDKILFVKIAADGFDLGAQRRAIRQNDLPDAFRGIQHFKTALLAGAELAAEALPPGFSLVEKTRIGDGGEWNLSGERYRDEKQVGSSHTMVPLGEVANLYQPQTITSKEIKESGQYKVFGANGIIGYFDEYNHEEREVLITCRGATCGTINMSEPKSWITGNAMVAQPKDENVLNKDFLYFLLRNTDLSGTISGSAQPQITRQSLFPFQIPLPPLAEQQAIVEEISGYQKIVDGARQVVEHYRPHIVLREEWAWVELGEVCEIINGRAYKQEELLEQGKYPVLRVGNFFSNRSWYYSDLELEEDKYCENGDLLYAWSASFGPKIWDGEKTIYHYHIWKMVPNSRVDKKFLYYILEMETEKYKLEGGRGIAMIHLTKAGMEKNKIPLPPLAEQQAIVQQIEQEQALVQASRALIGLFEEKIKSTIKKVWNK